MNYRVIFQSEYGEIFTVCECMFISSAIDIYNSRAWYKELVEIKTGIVLMYDSPNEHYNYFESKK